jgi:hypothetical protein
MLDGEECASIECDVQVYAVYYGGLVKVLLIDMPVVFHGRVSVEWLVYPI